jgi:DNA-binding Lrp family transcriptional regulator
MPKAYVKIWVEGGREETVRAALLENEAVMTADITAGEQDIITLIECKSYEDLLRLVMRRIRTVPGVSRTVTDFVLE